MTLSEYALVDYNSRIQRKQSGFAFEASSECGFELYFNCLKQQEKSRDLGDWLATKTKIIRSRNFLTQLSLCSEIGVTTQAIYNWESAKIKKPNAAQVAKLLRFDHGKRYQYIGRYLQPIIEESDELVVFVINSVFSAVSEGYEITANERIERAKSLLHNYEVDEDIFALLDYFKVRALEGLVDARNNQTIGERADILKSRIQQDSNPEKRINSIPLRYFFQLEVDKLSYQTVCIDKKNNCDRWKGNAYKLLENCITLTELMPELSYAYYNRALLASLLDDQAECKLALDALLACQHDEYENVSRKKIIERLQEDKSFSRILYHAGIQ